MPQLQYPLDNREAYQSRIRFVVKTARPITEAVQQIMETPDPAPPANVDPGLAQAVADKKRQIKAEEIAALGPQYKQNASKEIVSLFVPVSLQFNESVNYQNIDLGILGGDALAAMAGGKNLGAAALEALSGTGASFMKILSSGVDLGTEAGRVTAARLIPGTAGNVAKIAAQATTNPNTRTLFNNVNLRVFSFAFKMIPTSRAESEAIEGIVKHFRTEMYPRLIALNAGYEFPNAFGIDIRHKNQEVKFQKMPDCFLTGVDTVYNSTSGVFHADGYPSEVDMTLRFTEMRALSQGKVEEGF